ncbi:MAG TPA: nitroreductase family protein [Methanocella sp.]|uniref:nitroreductase family protein n=1 Tax=Methanocella sp. TaxID=2052833 RepID=UPI002C206DDC|nr:nitroreductase family protein [Methanocella sp.]HTY90649.1 nitroreductase family protein [Methanocella sp.]
MDVFEAIKSRKSIRSYADKDVEEEKLQKVLEAGRLAPSAKNRQEWRFIVVRDRETRKKLAVAAMGQRSVEQAPVTLVGCAVGTDYYMPCGQLAYTVDVSIALSFMMLEATELGLGTCWLGAFHEDAVKEILNIPDAMRVVAVMPLGYPAESVGGTAKNSIMRIVSTGSYRKPLDEIVYREKY